MPFGINAAPAMYQYVMVAVLERENVIPKPQHSTYLDDVMVGKKEGIKETWDDTTHAMERLTKAGLPINIWKCDLLTYNVNVLGMLYWDNKFTLGFKAMSKFLGSKIPTNLREL